VLQGVLRPQYRGGLGRVGLRRWGGEADADRGRLGRVMDGGIMIDKKTMGHILNSLKNPVVFTDMGHNMIYMNKAAIAHYEQGEKLLGTSIFDCHNENSTRIIREIFEEMKNGLDERMITDDEKHRIYMRAVRDDSGALIGYYERYEPPVKKSST
jgi:hypothetical protein